MALMGVSGRYEVRSLSWLHYVISHLKCFLGNDYIILHVNNVDVIVYLSTGIYTTIMHFHNTFTSSGKICSSFCLLFFCFLFYFFKGGRRPFGIYLWKNKKTITLLRNHEIMFYDLINLLQTNILWCLCAMLIMFHISCVFTQLLADNLCTIHVKWVYEWIST